MSVLHSGGRANIRPAQREVGQFHSYSAREFGLAGSFVYIQRPGAVNLPWSGTGGYGRRVIDLPCEMVWCTSPGDDASNPCYHEKSDDECRPHPTLAFHLRPPDLRFVSALRFSLTCAQDAGQFET